MNSIRENGVRLYVQDGKLKAEGGTFPEEMRHEATKHREHLRLLVELEQTAKREELADTVAVWNAEIERSQGKNFIGVVRNAVTLDREEKFEKAKADYLNGLGDLDQVRNAYFEWNRASRPRFVNRQLMGSIYKPGYLGERTSQADLHREFRKIEAGDESNKLGRFLRSSVTPQVEPQPDQLRRMGIYFGTDYREYIERAIEEKR